MNAFAFDLSPLLALLVMGGLGTATVATWDRIRPRPWRLVLVFLTVQQTVIAWGSWEANRADVDPGLRYLYLSGTMLVLLALLVLFSAREVSRRYVERRRG